MMNTSSREAIQALRERYPAGTAVELIRMEDAYAPPAGTIGKVIAVDDIGTVHIAWQTGSSLGCVPGVDSFRVLPVCPSCGKPYAGHPALSRKDNETDICPDCGMREALEAACFSEEKQREAIKHIPDTDGWLFTSVKGRQALMQCYGDSEAAYSGENEDGEQVLVSISHEGIVLHTYQSNGWVRINYYDAEGHPDGETFDGRWR